MDDVKRMNEAPEPKKNSGKETSKKGISRRNFLIGTGVGAAGLLAGGGSGADDHPRAAARARFFETAVPQRRQGNL